MQAHSSTRSFDRQPVLSFPKTHDHRGAILRPLITGICILLFSHVPIAGTIAAADAVAGAILVSPTPEPSGLGIRLLDVPAHTKDDPRARAYIVDRLAPGAVIQRRVQIVNNTGSSQSVLLYPGAARIENGDFVGGEAGTQNEVRNWTTLEQQELTLASGDSANVMATLRVPPDATEGEHYGAIWAEMRSTANQAAKSGVTEVNRVGIRIYLSIGPGNGKPADFTVTSVIASRDNEGSPQLSALVTNTGGRALDIVGTLTLSEGPGDLSAGPFDIQKPSTIVPAEAREVVFRLPPVIPDGPWTVAVRLKSGLLERETTAHISFPNKGSASVFEPVQNGDDPLPGIAVMGSGLLLAVSTATMLIRRHRRRTAHDVSRVPGQQST